MNTANFKHSLSTAMTTLADAVRRTFPWAFKAEPVAPGPISTPHLNEILLHLCDGNRDLALYVQRWIALPLRTPGIRMDRALWLYGGQGAGKSLFFERLIAPLFESRAVVLRHQLHEHFNDWALGTHMVVADEFMPERASMARIKQLLTSDKIFVRRKAAEPVLTRNRMNFVFMSGHIDALSPQNCDRRFVAIDVPPPLPVPIYKAAAAELANGACQDYYDYLLYDLNMDGFNQHSTPPTLLSEEI